MGKWEMKKKTDASVLEDAGRYLGRKCTPVERRAELRHVVAEGYRSHHAHGHRSDGIVSPSLSCITMCSCGWSMPKENHVCTHLYPLREESCGVHEERETCFPTCWPSFFDEGFSVTRSVILVNDSFMGAVASALALHAVGPRFLLSKKKKKKQNR